jgi:hypothetical protein
MLSMLSQFSIVCEFKEKPTKELCVHNKIFVRTLLEVRGYALYFCFSIKGSFYEDDTFREAIQEAMSRNETRRDCLFDG